MFKVWLNRLNLSAQFFPCNKTRYCAYIHRVKISGFKKRLVKLMTPSGYDFFTHAPHMQYALIRTSYHHHPQFLDQMLPKLNALNAENKNIKTTNKINIYADFPSFICGYQRNKKKCFQTFKISVGQKNLGANILWPPFWYHFWSRHIWISHPSLISE